MQADIVFAGAGLAGGLIAYRLAQLRPDLRLRLLDRDRALGGEHTWSFHVDDVSPQAMRWLAPFVVRRWAGQEVRFPGRSRSFDAGYCSITAERFREVMQGALGDAISTGVNVAAVDKDHVRLAGGSRIAAGAVIDGRGGAESPHLRLGYQKFVGLEIRTDRPHGRTLPLIMDATVRQADGYRFVYVLPFGPDRLLVEDTYYSAGPDLDAVAIRARVHDYAAAQGWGVAEVLREEKGVLPLIMAGDIEAFLASGAPSVAKVGLAGAFSHPVTGYTLPDAVRVADFVAALPHHDAEAIAGAVADFARRRWREQRFLRFLARMLILAATPDRRWRVLRHFYGLPEPLIARFYAGHPTLADKVRILSGKPPVPIRRALGVLFEQPSLPTRFSA